MPVSYCTPWRSVWLPRAVTAVALLIGLPLFLRTPPWCDITLYQMAARNILHGGVHYRDLFDTNLPGFVWAMTALSALFGPNVIAVRVVDLCVVLGVVLLIDRLAKWSGATLAGRWWAFAGAAVFYPFTVEMAHAQRDTWMALPGLAAVVLRLRRGIEASAKDPTPNPLPQGERGLNPAPPSFEIANASEARHAGQTEKGAGGLGSPFRHSFYEGLLWGAGVWMKPHIALMALTVWVLTARRLASGHPRPWRSVGADLLGNILGGLVVAVPGIAWLIASGAWDAFYNVFTEWNPRYMKLARYELPWRVDQELYWFPPWSVWLVVTVPLALVSVLDMAPWQSRARATAAPTGWLGRWLPRLLWDKQAGPDARFVRGTLGGLYLVWVTQAFLVQRGFQYAHVPETLLMIGIWAAHRWAWVPIVFVWLFVTTSAWVIADFNPGVKNRLDGLSADTRWEFLPRHASTNFDRLRLWPQCWHLTMTDAERYALWDGLRLHPAHEASIGWEELAEVAEFLRSQNVEDREVVAWFDSPHAVYLMLDIDPGFRYMHVHTAVSISVSGSQVGMTGRAGVLQELRDAEPPRKYKFIVNDLEWVALVAENDEAKRAAMLGPARNPLAGDLLPAFTPYPNEFPFNQPTVFRSRNGTGRYIVHRVVTLDDNR